MLKVVHFLEQLRTYIYIYIGFALLFSILLVILATNSAAFATDIETSVTIKPSLSLNIPTNTIIMNLDPSNHTFDEKDLTIKVGTNNLYGYKLFVNTVNGTSDTNLVNIADNTKTIPNLSTSTTVSDFPVNQWGYRFTPNATSSSGNYGVFTPSDSTPIMESTEPVNEDTATMGFAAKIDYNKPAGQYELNLNFKALPIVTTNYMQDIASDPTLANTICTEEPTVVIDKRDEQAYTIRRINGTCWMVENLQFTGTTMDSTTTNIAPEYTPQNPYRVNSGDGYYDSESDGADDNRCGAMSTGSTGSGNGFSYACIHKGDISTSRSPITESSTSTNISTVWYNYAAASAGTITGIYNTNPQIYDICPAGWELPARIDFDSVINNVSEFNPVGGGGYQHGSLDATNGGYWWDSNAYIDHGGEGYRGMNRYRLGWDSTNDTFDSGHVSGNRGIWSFYVRCVMKETGIDNLTYMQDFAKLNESGNAVKKQQVINSMTENETYTLADIRDNASYTFRKLGTGDIWMAENLKLGYNSNNPNTTALDLNPTNTNITANKTLTLYDAVTYGGTSSYCYGTYTNSGTSGSGDGYTYLCMHSGTIDAEYTMDNISKTTVWYNYSAATAGTIVGAGNTTIATEDICPAGWKLPNYAEGESLVGTTYATATTFNPAFDGYYTNGNISHGYGIWWGTWAYNGVRRGRPYVYKSDGVNTISIEAGTPQYMACSIRCVAK